MRQPFEDRLELSEFTLVEGGTTDNSVEVNSQNWVTIYYLEFEKGEAVALGQGRAANQTDAVGRAYAEFDEDGATDISSGKVRFVKLNRQMNPMRVISQRPLAQLAKGASDESARDPFPVQERGQGGEPVAIGYPYRIGIQMKLNSGTANVDDAEGGTTAELDAIRVEETG